MWSAQPIAELADSTADNLRLSTLEPLTETLDMAAQDSIDK